MRPHLEKGRKEGRKETRKEGGKEGRKGGKGGRTPLHYYCLLIFGILLKVKAAVYSSNKQLVFSITDV